MNSQDVFPTDQTILKGREIGGIVMALIIALIIGVVAAFIIGDVGTSWPAYIAAATFLILRPVFIPMFLAKLPIWEYKCPECGAIKLFASNGKLAAKEWSRKSK